jgi:hypothetical protein
VEITDARASFEQLLSDPTMTRRILTWLALPAVCCLAATGASAATISLGAQIPIAPNVFVLPIQITGGMGVASWQFDLSYDPIDVQINAACDPFSGDIYCSLVTGPVTEGDFFASGSPFNVLNPGFIVLDPATLMQSGLLLAVNGTFGGFPPPPSGDGVLAYVEFLRLGSGSSPITLQDVSVIETVPEPGTLALLTTGVLMSRGRRWRNRTRRT